MYDKPFQWGSKRTGPDLARVGGRYSNDWHVAHMVSPRAVVPESVMPAYPFLAERRLQFDDIAQHLKALRVVGVPYTDEMIAKSRADLEAQVNPDADPTDLLKRYPRAVTGKFNAGSSEITELDALIAYLQMLGTLVRISDIPPERLRQ
jgi:cytochrome c oxidase cbb3-type subunit 2